MPVVVDKIKTKRKEVLCMVTVDKPKIDKLVAYACQPLNRTDACTLSLLDCIPLTKKRPVMLSVEISEHQIKVNQRNWVDVSGNDVRELLLGALESLKYDGPPFSSLCTSKTMRAQLEILIRQALNDRTRRCRRQALGVDQPFKTRQPDPVRLQKFLDRINKGGSKHDVGKASQPAVT